MQLRLTLDLKTISCIVIMQTATSSNDTGILHCCTRMERRKGIGNSYSQYLKTSSTPTGTIAINGGSNYTPTKWSRSNKYG